MEPFIYNTLDIFSTDNLYLITKLSNSFSKRNIIESTK